MIIHSAIAQNKPQYKIYLTSEVNNQPLREDHAKNIFDCTDRIYIVVEASDLPQKKHDLTVKWLKPTGAQQEKTDYPFNAFLFTRIWAWLQLSGPPGSVVGQVFDPAFGMEEFIGEWTARVSINRKKIQSLPFTVIC